MSQAGSKKSSSSALSKKYKLNKCKIMGKILQNEKQATKILKSEMEELSKKI